MKNPEIATVPSNFAADTVCASAPFLMSGENNTGIGQLRSQTISTDTHLPHQEYI